MPVYDDNLFDPPAPLARVTLRNPKHADRLADDGRFFLCGIGRYSAFKQRLGKRLTFSNPTRQNQNGRAQHNCRYQPTQDKPP